MEKNDKRISQYDRILNYLNHSKRGLSQKQAINLYGAYRLSAIIHDLRRNGYNISTTFKTAKNRYGNSVTYAVYKLEN